MENKKLVISTKKFRGDSSVISARMPNALIEKIDSIALETGRTRNELIQTFIEFAIDNLEINNK